MCSKGVYKVQGVQGVFLPFLELCDFTIVFYSLYFFHSLYSLFILAFPKEIERFLYLFLSGSLVDADITDASEESEIDNACDILLVV